MQKRGQITIFLIVGVVILFTVIIFLLVYAKMQKQGLETSKESIVAISSPKIAVKNFVQSCLQKTSIEAIEFIGKRGGYYDLPPLSNFDFPVRDV